MFALNNDDKEVVLDGLRKAIAEYENRLTKGRRKSRNADVRHTQILLEDTFSLLKDALQHIEKSHEVIATSQALLEEMRQNEMRRADQADHRKEPPLRLTRSTL